MPDETVIDAWLDRWEDLRDRSQALSVDEFINQHCGDAPPALVEEFRANGKPPGPVASHTCPKPPRPSRRTSR